jgi:hypothetical protein
MIAKFGFAAPSMTESRSPSDPHDPGETSTATVAAALSLQFPRLQALLSARPQYREGDLVPYLLLAECYRWLAGHAAKLEAGDPEAEAVRELCGELFAMVFEHDALGAAFAVEMVEALLTERQTG